MTKTETGTDIKIIEAASELFHKSGIHWVSFQQIADQVGVSQSAIYRHFEDKDDVLKSCIENMVKEGRKIIDQNVNEKTSAKEQLYRYIEGNFLWLKKRPKDGALLIALYYFGLNNKSIQDLFREVNSRSEERLTIRLMSGQREGDWKIAKPELIARGIHGIMMGELIKYINDPSELPWKNRIENVWQMICALIGIED